MKTIGLWFASAGIAAAVFLAGYSHSMARPVSKDSLRSVVGGTMCYKDNRSGCTAHLGCANVTCTYNALLGSWTCPVNTAIIRTQTGYDDVEAISVPPSSPAGAWKGYFSGEMGYCADEQQCSIICPVVVGTKYCTGNTTGVSGSTSYTERYANGEPCEPEL